MCTLTVASNAPAKRGEQPKPEHSSQLKTVYVDQYLNLYCPEDKIYLLFNSQPFPPSLLQLCVEQKYSRQLFDAVSLHMGVNVAHNFSSKDAWERSHEYVETVLVHPKYASVLAFMDKLREFFVRRLSLPTSTPSSAAGERGVESTEALLGEGVLADPAERTLVACYSARITGLDRSLQAQTRLHKACLLELEESRRECRETKARVGCQRVLPALIQNPSPVPYVPGIVPLAITRPPPPRPACSWSDISSTPYHTNAAPNLVAIPAGCARGFPDRGCRAAANDGNVAGSASSSHPGY